MTKDFWKAALIRAIRTWAQAAVGAIGGALVLKDVNWLAVLSAATLAAVLSLLTSVATGLPEVEQKPDLDKGEITFIAYEDFDENGDPVSEPPVATEVNHNNEHWSE